MHVVDFSRYTADRLTGRYTATAARKPSRVIMYVLGIFLASPHLCGADDRVVDGAAPAQSFITVKDAPPPGFEDLAAKQTTEADIYFAGEYLLSAFVEFDPSHVEIADSMPIVESIPNLKNRQRIAAALAGPLPTNANQICTSRNRFDCGRLSPAVAAVIFDESRFRVDLYVNPEELLVQKIAVDQYLPASRAKGSLLHNVRLNVAGSGNNELFYISSESFVAYEQSRIRARYTLSQERATLYEMSWQHDAKDTEYEVGSFRTIGHKLTFTGDVDILGMRVATSTKTRTDLDNARGTPIFLFLPERSRIDVFRGDELLDTRYYDAGIQQIDSSSFPDGAYEITLVSVEQSGREQQTTQFFARSNLMPPMDEPQYFVEGGFLTDTLNHSIPRVTSDTWMRAGSSHRILESLAANTELLHAQGNLVFEGGLFYLAPNWHLHAGLMRSSNQDTGYTVSGGFQRGEFNFSLDYRQVIAKDPAPPANEFALIRNSYTQGSATASFPLGNGQAFIRARLNDRSGNRDSGIGFSYWGSLYRRNGVAVDFTFDSIFGSEERWIRAGINVRLQRGNEYATFSPQLQATRDASSQHDTDAYFNGRWNSQQHLNGFGPVNQALYLTHDGQRSALGARFMPAEYRHSDLEFGYQNYRDESSLYYSMNHRFSMVTSQGHTTFGEGGTGAGAVIVNIQGELLQKFQVLVDNRVVGYAWAQRPHVMPVRAYETYDVRIRPVGDNIVGYDQQSQRVTLYPGNVQTLNFTARELTVIIAQAQYADGTPVRNSRFLNVEGYGATDGEGWFQVEVGHREPLQLQTRNGETCQIVIQDIRVEDGLAVLDPLVCDPIPVQPSAATALDIGQLERWTRPLYQP